MERLKAIVNERTRGEPRSTLPADRYFVVDDHTFRPSYSDADYLSLPVLENEIAAFQTELLAKQRKVSFRVMNRREGQDVKENWENTHNTLIDEMDLFTQLDQAYTYAIKHGSGVSYDGFFTYHLTAIGNALRAVNHLHTMRTTSKRYGNSDATNPYLHMMEFANSGELFFRFGRLSLLDILTSKDKSGEFYGDFLRFYRKIDETSTQRAHARVLSDNQDVIPPEYPNIGKKKIEGALAYGQALRGGSVKILDELFELPEAGVVTNHATILESKKAVRKIEGITAEIARILRNPRTPQFALVSEALGESLNAGTMLRLYTLNLITRSNTTGIVELYRKAVEHVESGIEVDFYRDLAAGLHEYVELIPVIKQLHTFDDVVSIVSDIEEAEPTTPKDSFQEKLQAIGKARLDTSIRIDPQEIQWYGIISPKEVLVNTGKNGQTFTVNLVYNNEYNEEMLIILECNAKKDTIDWNLLESPEELDFLAEVLKQNVDSILQDFIEKKNITLPEKKAQQVPQRSHQRPGVVRERLRETRLKIEDVGDSISHDLLIQGTENEKRNIPKLQIVIPEVEDLVRVARVNPSDLEKILAKIETYNETGAGSFTAKKSLGPDGERQYTLRAGSFRVLLHEIEGQDGVRKFAIRDIASRGRVYKDNRM